MIVLEGVHFLKDRHLLVLPHLEMLILVKTVEEENPNIAARAVLRPLNAFLCEHHSHL
jgi:hypothetical protein